LDADAREPEASARTTAGALVVAGCDPALSVAETMLGRPGSAALVALDATTGSALGSLLAGGVHAAVVHGRPGHLPRPPVDVIRLQLASWQVGLGLAPGLKARSLAACLEQRVAIVQREETAASQQALRRAVRALGLELPAGAVASGHAAAARAAAVLGCAAISTEGAAQAHGLNFVPLELHTVEIWLGRRHERHPGLEQLGNLLSSATFAAGVAALGGYDLTGCGSLLTASPPRQSAVGAAGGGRSRRAR
ncbi:MAG: hypothetical protein KGL16_13770, partial [Acidobacteriota bacterium]|nr:hypothetical protein [Acidobacteriota bacterium]